MSESETKTYFFTLRIWAGLARGTRAGWRGKLQTLPGGEAYYFQGFEGLVERLAAILESAESINNSSIPDQGES